MRGSKNFRQGGGGVQVNLTKKALTTFIFCLVLSLFYRSQMVNFKEIYHFSRFKRGSDIFQGGGGEGVQLFPGGSNCLLPIDTHITCDFPGGGGVRTPCPPLWIRTWGCNYIIKNNYISRFYNYISTDLHFRRLLLNLLLVLSPDSLCKQFGPVLTLKVPRKNASENVVCCQ